MDKTEHLYFDGTPYFEALLADIENARRSIDLETYIFEIGKVGGRILDALERASHRGVRVRLLVDGFGSWNTIPRLEERLASTPLQFRVYHPIPPFLNLTRRNHRKTCVVDQRAAWIGSFNISDVHFRWRDTAIRIENEGFPELTRAFERAWDGREVKIPENPGILLNSTPALRRRKNQELALRVRSARKRVWITTPYLSPVHIMLGALREAAQGGADVRLLVPKASDVPGMSWMNSIFYKRLLRNGVRIYLYQPFLLHAKTVLADAWATVGSSNLNHRSWVHDLEADAVVTDTDALEDVRMQFLRDLESSKELTPQDMNRDCFLGRTLDRFGMRLRYWT